MHAAISKANIYICPTSVGGGLKLRIMDGLKAGLPVLTHIVSERGYDEFKKAGVLFSYFNKGNFEENLINLMDLYNAGNIIKDKIINIYNSVFSYDAGVRRLKAILLKNHLIESV